MYLESRDLVEAPLSFDLVSAFAAIGASLKRNVWVDQIEWCVYPNLSILLVAPSGFGKDTAINGAETILQAIESCKTINARTIEGIYQQMLDLGNPACCVILAKEFADFLGKKDYQASMTQNLTDLMSGSAYKDVSSKSEGVCKIWRPTLSIFAGSTPEWLHKALPPETLEGGFYPRFLIVTEDTLKKKVPLLKYAAEEEHISAVKNLRQDFLEAARCIIKHYQEPRELELEGGRRGEAAKLHSKWYDEREKYFSELVGPYAHRVRDHLLRIALISACTRLHETIDVKDISFAIELISYIAKRVDEAICPPNPEALITKLILQLLPTTRERIFWTLHRKYRRSDISNALALLQDIGAIKSTMGMIKSENTFVGH